MKDFKLDPQLAADTIELGELPVCKILLMNDSQFPWIILVPQRANITELYQLNNEDLIQVQKESLIVSQIMMQHFKGDKLNTGALGNIVSQLHLHHIVRFKNDPVWPKPVWGNIKAKPYSNTEINELKPILKKMVSDYS